MAEAALQQQELMSARFHDTMYGNALEQEFKSLGKHPDQEFKGLIRLAIVADVLDVVTTLGWLVIVGGVVLTILDIILDIYLFIKLGQKTKKTRKMVDIVSNAQASMRNLRRQYARVLRRARSIPGARRYVNRVALSLSKHGRAAKTAVRGFIARNPRLTRILGMAADKVWLLEIAPIRYYLVLKAKKDYEKQYNATLEQLRIQKELNSQVANSMHKILSKYPNPTPPRTPGQPASVMQELPQAA